MVATTETERYAEHIARWNPARVLAECDAKRRIVEEHAKLDVTRVEALSNWERGHQVALDKVLRLLALPYADRPRYREEWRP